MKRAVKRRKTGVYLVMLVSAFLYCLTAFPVYEVWAVESSHVPAGAEDTFAGALPPAGTKVFIDYFLLYNPGSFKDNSGNNAAVPGLGKVNFKTDVVVNSLRYIDVTKFKLLGGDFVWNVIVPVVYQHTSLSAGAADFGSQSKTGLGDIEFGGGIQWHFNPRWHMIGALEVVAPTGQYSKSDMVNIGSNFWSFNPLVAITYIGDKDSPVPGFEASSKIMYWINTINTETSYTSGQEFAADYFVGQHLGKWTLGGAGNVYYQTTKDKQYGQTASDTFTGQRNGNKGKQFTVGPLVSYNIADKGCITAKYLFPVVEENRPQGNSFWLKFIWTF